MSFGTFMLFAMQILFVFSFKIWQAKGGVLKDKSSDFYISLNEHRFKPRVFNNLRKRASLISRNGVKYHSS